MSQRVWPAAINGLHKTWLLEGCQMTFNIPDDCQQRGPHAEDYSSVCWSGGHWKTFYFPVTASCK